MIVNTSFQNVQSDKHLELGYVGVGKSLKGLFQIPLLCSWEL